MPIQYDRPVRPRDRLLAVLAAAIPGVVATPPAPAAPAAGKRIPSAFDLPVAPVRFAWPSPLAQRNDLYAVKGTPDGARIWAVGATGTVLSLHGADARVETTGTTMDLYDLWVAAPNDIWIVGARGMILHGDGRRWSPVRSGTKHALFAIWGRSADDLWIGGDGGTLLHRDGKGWQTVPTPTKGAIAGVVGCGKDEVCALTLASLLPNVDTSNRPCRDPDGDCPTDEPQEPAGSRILRWDGKQWRPNAVAASFDARRLVAAGGTLWVMEDARVAPVRDGKSEESAYLPKDKDTDGVHVAGVWAGSETDGWLVGTRCTQERPPVGPFTCNRGAIWRFDGRAATLRNEAPPGPLLAVWAWSKRGAIAVGERGTIVRFDGTAWTPLGRPVTDVDLRGVVTVPVTPAPGVPGPLARSVKDPAPPTATVSLPGTSPPNWALPRPSGPPPTATSTASVDIWLVADCEALRASGKAWDTFFPPSCEAGAATRRVLALEPGEVWMLPPWTSSSGMLWPDHWDGRAWTNVRSPSAAFPKDLWGSRADDVWIVGGRDAVHWDGRALTAPAALPGIDAADELTALWGSDASNVWAAARAFGGTGVKLLRWDGAHWQAAGSFDLAPPRRDRPVAPYSEYGLWPHRALEPRQLVLWGTSASDVWLGGPNGIVLRFDGSRWWRVPTPTRDPIEGLGGTANRVVAVGAAGMILELEMSGR